MNNQQTGQGIDEAGSQASYTETPYSDASWEIVGDYTPTLEFIPMQVEVMKGQSVMTDPMFADYGGVPRSKGHRFHLPGDMAERAMEAQEKAPEIPSVTLPEEEFEAIKRQAYEQGRADALAEANQIAQQKQVAVEQRMSQLLKDLTAQMRERLGLLERQAVDLSLAISKKIITFAVEISPEYIASIVNEAVGKSGTAKIKKVRVSPEDMEFIEVVGIHEQLKAFDGTWHFEKDDSIRSGCVVDTSAGEIDFRLEAAWDRVKADIVKVVR